MGMLLRHRPRPDEMTTTETMRKPSQEIEKNDEKAVESVKDEKPKTVKRGRPTAKK